MWFSKWKDWVFQNESALRKLSLVTSDSFTAIQEKKQNLMDFRHALQIPRVEAPRWVWHWVALGSATDCTSSELRSKGLRSKGLRIEEVELRQTKGSQTSDEQA